MKNKIRTLYIISVTINVSYMLLLNALHYGTNKTDRFRSTKIIVALLKQKFWLMWLEAEQCEGKSHRVHFCVFLHACGCTQGELKILIRLISRPYGPPLLYRSSCTSLAELYLCVCACACVHWLSGQFSARSQPWDRFMGLSQCCWGMSVLKTAN